MVGISGILGGLYAALKARQGMQYAGKVGRYIGSAQGGGIRQWILEHLGSLDYLACGQAYSADLCHLGCLQAALRLSRHSPGHLITYTIRHLKHAT